jgi:hypothetical protein
VPAEREMDVLIVKWSGQPLNPGSANGSRP